ncbi:MAG: tetratricopeptide repeat protein [Maricaulis sp.]|uniref:tetratricopeptide repeat protein n=1 Tax=Maricaulis sp. TaxID=1486257 RepID=UPI001B15C972|nr:tetratricopeptide repeat protein [Maricaulis sp.]MBO6728283.1 tetratricopeptide repeat protein [Maricaulis sp.]MBO6847897.1 tetratricopeptide repeat protein [Maricaulis sp.]MBO6877520.1 tetratricopeptide repeat protein [Maricaulis sp.]
MVDVFEEVEEELRNDKYQEALKKWGPWVGGAAAAIVLGAAGLQFWDYWRTSQLEESSDAFIEAMTNLEAGELALADAGFDTLSRDGSDGYALLSLMRRAEIALENGDNAQAASLYDQVAAASNDPLIDDLAQLKAVWARWDELSFADVEIRVSPLAAASAPYRLLARETIGAAALRAGDYDRAQSEYQLLAFSLDAPQGVQRRGQEALALIASLTSVQEEPLDDTNAAGPTATEDTPDNAAEEAGND